MEPRGVPRGSILYLIPGKEVLGTPGRGGQRYDTPTRAARTWLFTVCGRRQLRPKMSLRKNLRNVPSYGTPVDESLGCQATVCKTA